MLGCIISHPFAYAQMCAPTMPCLASIGPPPPSSGFALYLPGKTEPWQLGSCFSAPPSPPHAIGRLCAPTSLNPFSHLSRITRRTRFYICPSLSGQRTPAENKNIVSAEPSQSSRPNCINNMLAQICKLHVSRLLHKQCVG